MLRFKVAKEAFSRKAVPVNEPKERPSEYFGKYVFNREKMFKYLPKKTYEAVIEAIDNSTPLSREVADSVAAGMRKWALEMGATHYTQCFIENECRRRYIPCRISPSFESIANTAIRKTRSIGFLLN